MFELLSKMLVFILEAMKGTPQEGTASPTTTPANKKPVVILLLFVTFSMGLGYTWYEYNVKSLTDIYKLKETQNQKVLADIRRANGSLKEERIRLSAKVTNTTDKLTELTRSNNELKMIHDNLVSQYTKSVTDLQSRNDKIAMQGHLLDKLQEKIDNGAKDNRLIWDEIVTLGKEGAN
jgi:hypothetical protein